jgi:hypothetical protein
MHEAVVTTLLLYRGSGLGRHEGFTLQLLDGATRVVTSYRPPSGREIAFLRSARDGRALVGTRGFATRYQEVVEADLSNGVVRLYWQVDGMAALYPALAGDGAHLAALMIPGRVDLPPRHALAGSLMIRLLGTAEGASAPPRTSQVVASGLPSAPPDWSADSTRLYFSTRDRDTMYVNCYSLVYDRTTRVAEGVFPRSSPSGRYLAHIDRRKIVVRRADSWEVVTVHETEWGISWIDWSPAADTLAYAEEGPVYRTRVSTLDVVTETAVTIFETGPLQDLSWVSERPTPLAFTPYPRQ